MDGKVTDLAAVRASLARLDGIARDHPELLGPADPESADRWEALLRDLEEQMPDPNKLTAFRLPESLLHRLDDLAAALEASQPGLKVTRADAARIAMLRGLEALEADLAARKGNGQG